MLSTLTPVYTAAQVRAIEAAALRANPTVRLMERAGAGAAKLAARLVGDRGKHVLVIAGPGNNGGDALEVAVHLKRAFLDVSVVFAGDADKLAPDAALALEKWRNVGGALLTEIPPQRTWQLIVDGLFGIGLARPISGSNANLIDRINTSCAPILALDIPSGINGDTGAAQGIAVRATHTITFIGLKPGLLTLDGPDHCGELVCDTLGLDPASQLPPEGYATDARVLDPLRRPRPRNFHKGRAGTLAVVGGATGMVGAALLAGRAALKIGTGKVHLALLTERSFDLDVVQPELMIRSAEQLLSTTQFDALAVGPGMGITATARRVLGQVLAQDVPIVVDADALNLIATIDALAQSLISRSAPTIFTPHPAEAARLLGQSVASVQADRIRAACTIAHRFNAYTVLKGNGSVLASPAGRWWINTSGNPGMASAGMGDVLTGLIGALLAQRFPAEDALLAGTYLHGAAGDECVSAGVGPVGLTASELIDAARLLVNQSIRHAKNRKTDRG